MELNGPRRGRRGSQRKAHRGDDERDLAGAEEAVGFHGLVEGVCGDVKNPDFPVTSRSHIGRTTQSTNPSKCSPHFNGDALEADALGTAGHPGEVNCAIVSGAEAIDVSVPADAIPEPPTVCAADGSMYVDALRICRFWRLIRERRAGTMCWVVPIPWLRAADDCHSSH